MSRVLPLSFKPPDERFMALRTGWQRYDSGPWQWMIPLVPQQASQTLPTSEVFPNFGGLRKHTPFIEKTLAEPVAHGKPPSALWDHWLSTGRLTVIKQNHQRVVGRLTTPEGEFILKRFLTPDVRAGLRLVALGNPALREARRIVRAHDAGLATAELVAVGWRRDAMLPTESWLVTRSLTGAQPLTAWLPQTEYPGPRAVDVPDRAGLAERLGALIGQMHGGGLSHGDLHAGNILVQHDATGWRAWLVDLAELRRQRGPWSAADEQENLARLAFSLIPSATHSDCRRFWNSYRARRDITIQRLATKKTSEVSEDFGSLIQQIATLQRFTNTARRKMDRVWEAGNRRVVITPLGRGLAFWGRAALRDWQQRADEIWETGTPTQATASERLVELATTNGPQRFRMLKFDDRAPRWGWSGARSYWEMGHALRRRALGATVPWGYVEPRSETSASYVVCCDPPEAVTLRDWLSVSGRVGRVCEFHHVGASNLVGLADSAHSTNAITNQVADLLRRAAELGLRWETLTADDILIGHGGQWCGFRRLERLSWQTSGQRFDLAGHVGRLVTSVRELVRWSRTEWLRHLQRLLGGERAQWKRHWRQIAALQTRMASSSVSEV